MIFKRRNNFLTTVVNELYQLSITCVFVYILTRNYKYKYIFFCVCTEEYRNIDRRRSRPHLRSTKLSRAPRVQLIRKQFVPPYKVKTNEDTPFQFIGFSYFIRQHRLVSFRHSVFRRPSEQYAPSCAPQPSEFPLTPNAGGSRHQYGHGQHEQLTEREGFSLAAT